VPIFKFDKRSIDKLPFTQSGQIDYFDTRTPGLGLRVGMNSKTFFVKADVKDPTKPRGYRTAKKTLGRFGDLTLEQARREVEGYDHPEKGFVPGRRLLLKRDTSIERGASITLDEMLSFYFEEKKRQDGKPFKPSTAKSYTRIIQRHFKTWLPLTLSDLAKFTPETVIERHKQAAAQHGAYGARNAFVMLTAIINYAQIRHPGVIPVNPLNVLRLGKHLKKIEARTDKLEGSDFKKFYDGIQHFNDAARDAYLLCLFQGLRHMEAAGLKWEHVRLDKSEIFVPDTKNRHPLHVPLSRQSIDIIKQRLAAAPADCPWVFPAARAEMNKTGHVRLQADALRLRTGLDITLHGLRRTFITTARRLKIFEDADRLTNHVDSSTSGRHYDGTNVDDLRVSLQTICNEIERLMIDGVGARVVALPAAKGA
jgi:integrase